jgi:hypothetical protein
MIKNGVTNMPHSYEEIRAIALDILSGREENLKYPSNQYNNLKSNIGEVFARREGKSDSYNFGTNHILDKTDSNIYLEVFWDFFRHGIITLGVDDSNPNFPWFRFSVLGKKIADNKSIYFFHDVSTYEKAIRLAVPTINETTMLYLKEAMQAFYSGCILSSTVILGVATEHTFLLLLETIENNPIHQPIYKSINDLRTILQKINKFKNILDQNSKNLSSEIKEDLDTHFASILSIIRTFRNDSGHPSGKIIDREQAFILLQLYIPYCKKLYKLIDHFHS